LRWTYSSSTRSASSPFSENAAEALSGILAERYERGSVLVANNLGFASWTDVLGDARPPGLFLTASPAAATSSSSGGTAIGSRRSLRRREKTKTET